MKDLSNNIVPVVSIINAVKTAAANGTGVDLQGYESATVLVDVGAEGDTLSSSVYFELSLEESDDDSTYTDVVQADIVDGTIASGGIFFRVGYVGNKRYIRVVLAKTGTHSNGTPIGAMVVKGSARHSEDNAFTAHNA
jgi:hypothetical protein